MDNLANGMRVLLASNFAIYLKSHIAHFNVTGPNFFELHKMLDEQYKDIWENFDTMGEKIRELDHFVTFSPAEQISLSVIEPFEMVLRSDEYVAVLIKDHDRMIALFNKVFLLAQNENNQAIMNYFAERLNMHAKFRWMLKATIS